MDSVSEILRDIRDICSSYGHGDKADFIGRLLDETPDTPAFWRAVSGLEFWGGAGAIWEVEPFYLSHPDSSAARDDHRRFQTLMVQLADVLKSRDLDRLAARTASLFRRRLEES